MRPESACAKAIVLSLLSLVVLPARASIIHVQINGNGNPAYIPQFGGISFDVNTAATADTATAGSCGGGSVSGVYNTMVATGLAQALIGGYDDYEPVDGQATIQTVQPP